LSFERDDFGGLSLYFKKFKDNDDIIFQSHLIVFFFFKKTILNKINITLFIEILTKQVQYTVHQTPNQIVEKSMVCVTPYCYTWLFIWVNYICIIIILVSIFSVCC